MICDFFHESQTYQENLLAKYYLKNGHDVTVIASKYEFIIDYYNDKKLKKTIPKTYLSSGIRIIRLNYKLNILSRVRLLKGLKNHLISEDPDVVYVHGLPLNLISCINYKKNNINTKIVFDSHADYTNSGMNWVSKHLLHGGMYRFILNIYLNRIDKFFFITPHGGKFMKEVYKIPEASMKLLPLGADIDYIEKIKNDYSRNQLRKEMNIKPTDFVVFTGGKLSARKKTELVIKAFILLNREGVHLIIAGKSLDDEYNRKIFILCKENPNIHLSGWINSDKLNKCLLISDVAVYPSSNSVLWQQSIGVGLPLIVGEDSGQEVQYLNRNNNMFILEEKNVTALVIKNILFKLIENKKLLNSMKKGALKTTEEFLSYDSISKISINFSNK